MRTVLDHVLDHAARRPEASCVRLATRRSAPVSATWGDVAARAARAAAFLRARGLGRGDVLVLIGTHHLDLYATWLGAQWLGAVPTILAEPSVRIDQEVYWSRLGALVERIRGRMLAVDPRVTAAIDLPRFTYEEIAAGDGSPTPAPCAPAPDEVMLLQHSSGTTGLQKGVMLSHGAVLRHAESYARRIAMTAEDRVVSWLPLYHDMGFIACFVDPLIVGAPVTWLSPFEWVASPGLLLEAAAADRATLCWLPNFAFSFLAQRVRELPAGTDLSSLRAVINCSEPVTAEAMDAFVAHFARWSLPPGSVQACYAMAENVFAVTTTSAEDPPRRLVLERPAWLERHQAVDASAASGAETVTHVSNGTAIDDCEVRIADEHGAAVPARTAGRILIRSSFLFTGYFRREDLAGSLFDAEGFYDTGDLGYVDETGHVYVTGRRKDLVIVGGRNVYPQDVEQAVAEVPGVHPGRVVCFGVTVRGLGTEGLVVLFETEHPEEAHPALIREVRTVVPRRLDLDLVDVRIAARGGLRKSTSGKLAREGNREWYLAGRFGAPPPNVSKEGSS